MNQPPALDVNCETPRSGCFIGSTASRFVDQQTNDIYLDHYWSANGPIDRVAFICIHWGLLGAFVESAVAPVVGQPGPFSLNPGGTGIINIQNMGQEPEVQGPLPNVVAQPTGMWSNGVFVPGHSVPWHDKLELSPIHAPHIHYHAHKKRNDHQITPDIKPDGKYKWGQRITLGTHVQNFRRLTR